MVLGHVLQILDVVTGPRVLAGPVQPPPGLAVLLVAGYPVAPGDMPTLGVDLPVQQARAEGLGRRLDKFPGVDSDLDKLATHGATLAPRRLPISRLDAATVSLAIMSNSFFDNPVARAFNRLAVGLTTVPVLGKVVGRSFQTPVNYRLSGDQVTIRVMGPDAKSWWRNFLGDGGPITLLNFRGADRTGLAIATRDDQGRVTVRVRLD